MTTNTDLDFDINFAIECGECRATVTLNQWPDAMARRMLAHCKCAQCLTGNEAIYVVEGCGPDMTVSAMSAKKAARHCARWQYSNFGEHAVTLEWIGTGPDAAIAEYLVRVDGAIQTRRVVVRIAR